MRKHKHQFSVRRMAKVLQVSHSGYYDWLKTLERPSDTSEEAIKKDIAELFMYSRCSMGSRQLAAKLTQMYDYPVNRKRVCRHMREQALFSKVKRKYVVTTDSRDSKNIYPNVLKRDFDAERPNQKMVSDTTYIWTKEGWLYVAGIMDLCGRKIVGLAISDKNDTQLVLDAFCDVKGRVGKKNLKGCILHSDRGSTYASKPYITELQSCGITISMSKKGDCWDNAPMESFWGKMKMEWLQKAYQTKEEAIKDVLEYAWSYHNVIRPHSANGNMTPAEYYKAHAIA